MKELCRKLNFPEEAISVILSAKEKINSDFKEEYELFINGDVEQTLEKIGGRAKQKGICRETAEMLFLLTCVPYAKKTYEEKNISDEIFYDTFLDLLYKLYECYNSKGVWGIFVTFWMREFLRAERFALGRLQFETVKFEYDYKDEVKKGDIILNCHIPSSGPLTEESVQESLKKAYEFYKCEGIMYVMCHSWLLYPPYYELFGKNTKAFADLFDVFETGENNIELWRIFGKWNFEDIRESDLKTSMQKNFYNYLKEGGKTGFGIGMIKYRPE